MRFPPVLVFDCGASRVSAASFSATTDGVPVLEQILVEPLEYDTADDQQWVRAVGDAIRRISTVVRLRGHKISLIVPGHLSLTKYIKVPHVDESKRQRIIQFEARQNIPYALEEVVWDYQIVYDDGIDFEVALCAIKLDIVESLLVQCRDIGFEPDVIEPSCMGQVNAFGFCYRDARQSTLLINIGARSSNLVFLREDRYFVRNITLAGGAVTQAIAEELGRGLAEAERIKLDCIRGRSDEPVSPEAVRAFDNARQSFATRLSLEITRSIANYRRQSSVEAPARVLVTGLGAQVPGLAALLAEKLKIAVEPYEPLRGVPFGSGSVEGEFRAGAHVVGEAVGSALRIYQRGLAQFNFLPDAVVRARAFRRRQPYIVSAAACLVATLAVPVMVFWVTRDNYFEKVRSLETQVLPLRSYSQKIEQARADAETVRKQISGIQGLVETKSNWISLFRDLQERLVKIEDVWLDSLEVQRPQGAVTGIGQRIFGQEIPRPVAAGTGDSSLRLRLTGRLLDKNNPQSKVSYESQQRVKTLLNSFTESQFIVRLENERFDNSQAGILKFDFILVVNPERPL